MLKETKELVNYVLGLGSGAATGLGIGFGSMQIADYLAQIESIRNSMYSRATEITPELIQMVSETTDMVSKNGLCSGLVSIALAGFCAVPTYIFTKRYVESSE